MADGVQVSRSTQLVSLDTHPANNALVVTYEILVSIVDAASQRELSRRNKRAQMQIHIRQLDQLLEERDFRAGKIDLGRVSSEIIQKCPLLSSASNFNLEDIQLHLLYLINRRQSSLLMRNQERPPSSAPIRPASRLHSAAYGKQTGRAAEFAGADIYTYIRLLEARNQACCFDLQGFELRFNERLDSIEATHQDVASQINNLPKTKTIDGLLEGLYGDRSERFLSLAALRRMCVSENENRLADIGFNRLLICAMMRILRDSSADEYFAREFILCCLIRIISYQEIYMSSFEHQDTSIDLIKVLCDLLAEHLKLHQKESSRQEEPLASVLGSSSSSSHSDNSYDYLCAILVVFLNLFKISKNQADGGSSNNTSMKFEERLMSQNSASILSDLFQLNARDLMREIRLMGKPAKVIQLLQANILLLKHLSCMREFIQRLRVRNQFFESIVTLLNCLQLSRPGSGGGGGGASTNAAPQSVLIRDEQTLSELYHMELNLLMLVNNLLMDSRIRTKLIKRKLLKPVLRNLVIFLAVAGNSLLDSGDGSSGSGSNSSVSSWSLIMLVPFRSLYELSCDKSVRLELYKSKIIMKCLLEYLLSSLANYPSAYQANRAAAGKFDWLAADCCAIIEPNNVSHYILSVWINLTSLAEAPIYSKQSYSEDGADLELKDLVNEYVDLVLDKLLKLSRHDDEMFYLHLKLLRNLSQFSSFNKNEELEFYQRCLNRMSELTVVLFDSRQNLKPFLVECLATLDNLIAVKPIDDAEEEEEEEIPEALAAVLAKLLQLKCENFHGEEDDDLLLVAIQLIGNLANKFELCRAINQEALEAEKIYAKILRACNFVLDSKLTDYEMIIHTLYSLSQLMNHAQFLKSLLAVSNLHDEQQLDGHDPIHANRINDSGQDEQDSGSNLSMSAELLANKLANLVLCHTGVSYRPTAGEQQQQQQQHQQQSASPLQGAQVIPRLALELLNIFRQLEQQTSIECSFVHKIRFAQYNSKWLAAIRASREALESPTSPATAATRNGQPVSGSEPPDVGWFGGGNRSELLFDQSVGAAADDDDEDEDEDIRGRPLPATIEEAEEEEDKLDNSEGSSGGSNFSEAPDLNVIDPKSMIKHLSSRRQLRQMQQQRQH